MDGGVATWEKRAMDDGRIRLDGVARRMGAQRATGRGKVAGRVENDARAILGTFPPSTPYLPPTYSPSYQPNPTTRFLCKRRKRNMIKDVYI